MARVCWGEGQAQGTGEGFLQGRLRGGNMRYEMKMRGGGGGGGGSPFFKNLLGS